MTPIKMLPLSAIIINQGIEPYKISPTLIGTFTDEVIWKVLFRQPQCWDFIRKSFLSYIEDIILQHMSWSLDSHNLSASSIMFSDVQCRGYVEDVLSWDWMPRGRFCSLHFWSVTSFKVISIKILKVESLWK